MNLRVISLFEDLPDAALAKVEALCTMRSYAKGEEMGYFQHGSTIIAFATPNYRLAEGITAGHAIRMGEALLVDALTPPSQS